MARRPAQPEVADRPRDRSWSSRLAWGVLVGGGALVLLRMAFATVVKVHGDGMAPTLVDGDHVLLLRGLWSIDRGDVVVYAAPLGDGEPPRVIPAREHDAPRPRSNDGREFPDARAEPGRDLRNTAVVDPDELGEALDENWKQVQRRADAGLAATTSYRVGRVLASPGDRVTLSSTGLGLGITVDGDRIEQKDGTALPVHMRDATQAGLRRTLWESSAHRRYLVLDRGLSRPDWRPLLHGVGALDTEIVAPGYLVLADNRDEGRCCDSRTLGWIEPGAIRGEVLVRLGGAAAAGAGGEPGADDTDRDDPAARGLLWKP
jgi:signal peptidase I